VERVEGCRFLNEARAEWPFNRDVEFHTVSGELKLACD